MTTVLWLVANFSQRSPEIAEKSRLVFNYMERKGRDLLLNNLETECQDPEEVFLAVFKNVACKIELIPDE